MTGKLPQIELLEATHDFPAAYVLKVIGSASDDFVTRIVAAVQDELGGECELPFRTRETPNGRHVSVTFEPIMQSAEQIVAVYQRVYETAGVVMVL